MTITAMNPIPEQIQRELTSSEQLHWWGRPRQGLAFRGSDVFAIPFSVLWCGFAIFWEYSVLQAEKAPGFFALWGIPFVCIGLYMVFGRFFADARQRANTYYAVSSERILIVSGLFSRTIKSLSIRTLTDVSLDQKSSGEGSITFGPQPANAAMFGNLPGWPGAEKLQGPRFDLIPDAKHVYEVIRQLQA